MPIDWNSIVRILLVGALIYAFLVALLRVSGKRTLAKMNAFDLVVTVALGSALSAVLLQSQIGLLEGVTGLAVLIGLQFAIAWASVRSAFARRLLKASPRLLLQDGEFDRAALLEERVAVDEVLAAIRSSGEGDLESIAAVILETDGSFSVITCERAGSRSALATVRGAAKLEPVSHGADGTMLPCRALHPAATDLVVRAISAEPASARSGLENARGKCER